DLGKSTFLNRVVGQKLSIVSAKPQSTRDRVVGIVSDDDTQMIVFDTPGLLNPRYALQRAMRGAALDALFDADVVVYLADAKEGPAPDLAVAAQLDRVPAAPVLRVYNKADAVDVAQRAALAAASPEARFISALTGEGVAELLAEVKQRLPESPFLYDSEDISTQSMRFFTAELVRESALEQLDEEVPYSLACEVEEFRETRTPVYIRAVLYVERESQKRILIGAKGTRIRAIGQSAREKVQALVGQPVYLDLWVKVLANWRKNERAMQRFGYRIPEEKPR
ncbi:MAG: GTPase Era, partial [Gemmatimonadaceae bacterium]|nr:GTPase Era [Gemmatimonadaceae bacterium]